MSEPFVSVVTPFHNTAAYLAECIESVLAQTHTHFEYVLVDNCSTDGSSEIADTYRSRDKRIRLIRRPQLLSQVENYNRAIEEIAKSSLYCKVVQADDFIFPDCLRLMVQRFAQSESIGLVSSYWLKGNELRGSGFPFPATVLPGKEMARLYLRTGLWVFGSPSAVMYRSSMIEKGRPFYDESQLHEDTEKCMQILEHWDFGFVPQVLSFSRADNQSISSAVRDFQPNALDRYIVVRRYASTFLAAPEAEALQKKTKREYYAILAHAALRRRESAFWQYHRKGLNTLGEKLSRPRIALQAVRQWLWMLANPASTAASALRSWKRGKRQRESGKPAPSLQA